MYEHDAEKYDVYIFGVLQLIKQQNQINLTNVYYYTYALVKTVVYIMNLGLYKMLTKQNTSNHLINITGSEYMHLSLPKHTHKFTIMIRMIKRTKIRQTVCVNVFTV